MRWAGALLIAAALLGSSGARAHDWYEGLKSPPSPISGVHRDCCAGDHCEPVPSRWIESTAEIEVLIKGQWWNARDPRWLLPDEEARPDEDGKYSWHGCMTTSDTKPRCVIAPPPET